jgi:uncharacterized repeat protein (TIGR03803 family)
VHDNEFLQRGAFAEECIDRARSHRPRHCFTGRAAPVRFFPPLLSDTIRSEEKGMGKTPRGQRASPYIFGLAIATLLVLSLMPIGHAQAWIFKRIHTFCLKVSCTDGASPYGGLVLDAAGNLYGTTYYGGAHGHGLIYRLAAPVNGKRKFQPLHSFCATAGCPDGDAPGAQLILDVNGNLYGTTSGGSTGDSKAFELIKGGTGWTVNVLHTFCGTACGDGAHLYGSLSYQGQASGAPYDGASPLYGTTDAGGANSQGTVFSLTPPAPGKTKWVEKILYNFCKLPSCADGANPFAAVLVDDSGNLFGTTNVGGAHNFGSVFKLIPPAPGAPALWTESVIYSFCPNVPCVDGYNPSGNLIMDAKGNLLGTAPGGGVNSIGGVVFKLTAGGKETARYNFCSLPDCADGRGPYGGLVKSGHLLFGTTYYGGNAHYSGTVFQLSGTTLTTIKIFCEKSSCADGAFPADNLVIDGAGNLFGLTTEGGNGSGTVFELSP